MLTWTAAASRAALADDEWTFINANISADDQVTFAIGLVGMAETVSRQVLRHGRDFDPDALGRAVAALAWGGLRLIGQPNT